NSGTPAATPLGLTGAAAQAWINSAVTGIQQRWNAVDGTFNVRAPTLTPTNGTALRFANFWFVQSLPQNPASQTHFEIGIYQDPPPNEVRAFMNGDGHGELDQSDNAAKPTGRFVSAHEMGHVFSLADEYVETVNSCSYHQKGILENIAGAPFLADKVASTLPD